MKILVTGGAGYIGSHTSKALAKAGYDPAVVDDFSHGHRWAVQWGACIEGDLGNTAMLSRVFREHEFSAVIHFAGQIMVGESVVNPRKYFWENSVNTLNLLDAMLAADVKTIVFSSTAATYGTPMKTPLAEDHPLNPVNPYGDSKLFVERILKWYGEAYALRWAALRYFNASGADEDGDLGEEHDPETHLIPLVIQAALGQRSHVEIYGTDYPTPDGTAIRDYIHVTDLAEAHVLALEYLMEGGDSCAMNLGTGQGYSVRDVIAEVAACSQAHGGTPPPVREATRRAGDPAVLIADPSRAERMLNWKARRSGLEEIVRTAWRWHSRTKKPPAP
jgi:UDP-arabinose 4-epimerase